jgi:hypothetical protein
MTGMTVRQNVALAAETLTYTAQKGGVDTTNVAIVPLGGTQAVHGGEAIAFDGLTEELGLKVVESAATANAGIRARICIMGYPVP